MLCAPLAEICPRPDRYQVQVPDSILIDARTPIVSNMKYLGAYIASPMGKSYLAPLLTAEQKRACEHFYKKETLVEVVDSLVDKAKADAAVLTRDVVRVNSEVVNSARKRRRITGRQPPGAPAVPTPIADVSVS